ncbi:hypothetical protein [Microbispora sp. NPDC049125]|uniref:hypothetical protein n=1 Tax=Microbispora sp. NPDC049125 TaxID=3154929 RepID=UPI0034663F98
MNNDLIKATSCRGVRLPRMPETEPHILTREEVARLTAAMREPHGLIVQLLAYGGLRIGEAFALRRRHVQLDKGCLIVAESLAGIAGKHIFDTPKSHQRREITLPGFVISALRSHFGRLPEDSDALPFTGGRVRPSTTTPGGDGTSIRLSRRRAWTTSRLMISVRRTPPGLLIGTASWRWLVVSATPMQA